MNHLDSVAEVVEKPCRICEKVLPQADFQPSGWTARYPHCRKCNNQKRKRYRQNFPERDRQTRRNDFRKHSARCREETRRYLLKKKFGLSESAFNDLLESQNGVCAICGGKPAGRRLAVDHDHKTGRVRGLLCLHCNTGLGNFKDSVALLGCVLAYLKRL